MIRPIIYSTFICFPVMALAEYLQGGIHAALVGSAIYLGGMMAIIGAFVIGRCIINRDTETPT